MTIVLTDQVSLAFGLPTSTFNAASLAHYMSGTAGLQALAAAGKATFSKAIGGLDMNDVTHFISVCVSVTQASYLIEENSIITKTYFKK